MIDSSAYCTQEQELGNLDMPSRFSRAVPFVYLATHNTLGNAIVDVKMIKGNTNPHPENVFYHFPSAVSAGKVIKHIAPLYPFLQNNVVTDPASQFSQPTFLLSPKDCWLVGRCGKLAPSG